MQRRQLPLLLKQRQTRLSTQRAARRRDTLTMATPGSPLAFSGLRTLATRVVAFCVCVLTFSSALFAPITRAASNSDLSDFILNVVRYASWPADPSRKSITICHAHGGMGHTGALATDVAATVKGLPVVWRQVTAVAQVPGCNVLWLNADVRPAPREWLNATHDQPILTISNYADFTADGGVVGAYRVGSDWRFEINLESLQRSKINIAAAALRLSQKPKAAAAAGGEAR